MYVSLIERPAPIVSLADAKRHLRVDHVEDDAQILGLTFAAQQHLDGPGGWLGRALGEQTLLATLAGAEICPGAPLHLPFPPFLSLEEFAYTDADGVEQTLSPSLLAATDMGSYTSLAPIYGGAWPVPRLDLASVRITYRAGYVNPELDIEPMRLAVLMLVAHWYENREPVSIGGAASTLPFAVEALLGPYRVWR